MKKYLLFAIIGFGFLFGREGFAQTSEIFAGGEIQLNYVGDYTESCGDPLPYEITLKFYRDNVGPAIPLDDEKTILMRNQTDDDPSKWTIFTITLDEIDDRGQVETNCLFNPPTTTEGRWYTNSTPVMIPSNANLKFAYGTPNGISFEGRTFQSPENNNIKAAQKFYIETLLNTECGEVITGPNDNPPNERVEYNLGFNKTPVFLSEDISETFCADKSYSYDVGLNLKPSVIDNRETPFYDTVSKQIINRRTYNDSYTFELKSVQRREGSAVFYETSSGRSSTNPFPSSTPIIPPNRNTGKGMTFTPTLDVGSPGYIAAMAFGISEYRTVFELTPDGFGNFNRIERLERVSYTLRQMRFLIGDNCNKNLPDFSSEKFNASENAWEFDCATDKMTFTMSKPMLASTLHSVPPESQSKNLDFRIFRGNDPLNPGADDPEPIEAIIPLDINERGEFTQFEVIMERSIGPGNYVMFLKTGGDGNTLRNKCGFEIPDFYSIPIYVNGNYDYDYKDGGKPLLSCFSGEPPGDYITPLNLQTNPLDFKERADSFYYAHLGSSQMNNNPFIEYSGTGKQNSRYLLDTTYIIPDNYEFPDVPLQSLNEGFWRVGVRLRYPYTLNEIPYAEYCYDEDVTVVDIIENPKIKVQDYDICIGEKWPVVKDLLDPKFIVPGGSPTTPVKYIWQERVGTDVEGDDIYVSRGGSANKNTVNDTLVIQDAIAVALNTKYYIRSIVEYPNECRDTNAFTLIKQDVKVEIGEDSMICENNQYLLLNSLEDTYLVPDSMTHEWYLDGKLIEKADSESVMITEKGLYKLMVTKRTKEGSCFGADSVYINIVEEPEITEPICSKITFKNGDIEQLFFWPAVENAEDYEVRGIDQNGDPTGPWELSNDLFGLHHRIRGAQLRLEVRAVNREVGPESECKYGPAAIAEACEARVSAPNIFTPNGDGVNDVLAFNLVELFPGSKLQVFNRWGRLVYEDSNYYNDWDGGDLKDGTYFYILDVNDPKGIEGIFKGNVTIVR